MQAQRTIPINARVQRVAGAGAILKTGQRAVVAVDAPAAVVVSLVVEVVDSVLDVDASVVVVDAGLASPSSPQLVAASSSAAAMQAATARCLE